MFKELYVMTNMNIKYKDPDNVDVVMEQIRRAPTIGDVKEIADKIFPKWIVAVAPDYCPDYSEFLKTWDFLCSRLACKKQCVLIVEYLIFEDPNNDYTLIRHLGELLTRAGYSVRRQEEFVGCTECHKAIVSPILYEILKKQQIPVPEIWTQKCSNC
jgi:hypothetical protein